MEFFEIFVTSTERFPEILVFGIVHVFTGEVGPAIFRKPGRKDMDGDMLLAVHFGIQANGIYLLYTFIGHWHAPHCDTAAVNIDIAAPPCFRPLHIIGIIGVIEEHRQMVIALRVEVINKIVPLGHLVVALSAFGSEDT